MVWFVFCCVRDSNNSRTASTLRKRGASAADVEHTFHVGLVHLLQASEFRHGFTFVHFSPKRNSKHRQHHHHGRISSILSVCPIVCCSDVGCDVSGTFNDDLCALFGWFGRRQMAKIQIHDFRLVFSCCSTCLLQYRSFGAFTDPQNASDPSFRPYVMFLVFFLAACRRLAVILVRKIRPDGSSTVGNSLVLRPEKHSDPSLRPCGIASGRWLAPAHCLVLAVRRRLAVILVCKVRPDGSFTVGKSLVLRREKHPILRYVHAGLLLVAGRRPPIVWSAVIVQRYCPLRAISPVSIM
jgi:hypothetical protein